MSEPRILKFHASWCTPCKALSLTLKGLELPYEVVSIDIDDDPELGMKFSVRGVPTLVLVDADDNVLDRMVGSVTKEQLLSRFGTPKK